MGKFISTVVAWFIRVKTNPIVAAIGTVVVETISKVPPEVPLRVVELVSEASGRNEDNRARFVWVLNKVRQEFPELQESLVRTLIESSVLLVKKGSNG